MEGEREGKERMDEGKRRMYREEEEWVKAAAHSHTLLTFLSGDLQYLQLLSESLL